MENDLYSKRDLLEKNSTKLSMKILTASIFLFSRI